jgi:pilus assembly protein CpaE
MAYLSPSSKLFNAVAITVCVDPKMSDELLAAIASMPWQVTSSSFDSYISAARRPSFGPQMKSADACIAFVNYDTDLLQAIETTAYLQQTFVGKLTVIAVAKSRDPHLVLTAMRSGCSEFLPLPLEAEAIGNMLDLLEQRWAAPTRKTSPAGLILTLFGAKGGVGTTTLAVHLAMYLVQLHKKRVLLIDNHAELGHVCIYLGLDATNCLFSEVVKNVGRLDSELLHGFVAKHSSGLEVLSSPDAYGPNKHVDAEPTARLLEFLRSEYDFVILDCPTSAAELAAVAVEASARVYLVATPEIGAVRNLSRHIDRLMQIDETIGKMHVVLNRFPSPHTVSLEQIEKAMRMPIGIKIPNNTAELMRSENLGQTVPPGSKSDFALQLTKWASELVGSTLSVAPAKASRSMFSLWK